MEHGIKQKYLKKLDSIIIFKKFLIGIQLIFLSSCTNLFYQPDHQVYTDPSQFGFTYKDVFFNSSDNTKLHAWLIPSILEKENKDKNLILFFHGNAQNLSSHFLNLLWLAKLNFDIFIFDYRGYGKSEGDATVEGIQKDGIAALLKGHQLFKEGGYKKFIIYGQSIGGVVLLKAFESFKEFKDLNLVVLDSTFISYQNLAFDKLKSTWATFLLSPLAYLLVSDEAQGEKGLASLTAPTLVIHGTNDLVVPYKFGEEIFKNLKAEKKWFWKIENGDHTDVFFRDDKKNRDPFTNFIKDPSLPPK